MTETSDVLDAEYREFVRSLHDSTVAVYVAIQSWNDNPCQRVLGTLLAEGVPSVEDIQGAVSARNHWQDVLFPRLSVLINGHPDPDVRDSARLFGMRVYAVGFVLDPVLRATGSPDLEVVHRVHDLNGVPLRRLRDAVRDAPFRLHRPLSPSERERYPDDQSLGEAPRTFHLWLDRLGQWERDFRPGE